jgi:hypothetical protein
MQRSEKTGKRTTIYYQRREMSLDGIMLNEKGGEVHEEKRRKT